MVLSHPAAKILASYSTGGGAPNASARASAGAGARRGRIAVGDTRGRRIRSRFCWNWRVLGSDRC